MNWWLALIPGLALVSGCAMDPSGEEVAVESKSQNLIGGAPVAQGDYAATVGINNNCSATKVGSHLFLTAAHCVQAETPEEGERNDGLGDNYVGGSTIQLNWGLDGNDHPQGTYTIEETLIHPEWNCFACPVKMTHQGRPDIALIRLVDDTPQIPEARVELSDVLPGQRVVKVGYGCQDRVPENQASAGDGEGLGPLKAERGWTVPVVQSAPPGSYPFRGGFEPVDESYLTTSGHGRYSGFGSLCLGDSGGPLYLDGVPDLRVVGVNSDYIFHDQPGISWSDLHTRTSLSARHGVASWLASHGVNYGWSDLSRGTITFQRWNNIGGVSVSQFPGRRPPQVERNIDRFEIYAGQNENGDNYGVLMSGYLIPPQSGTYVFSIAGDDNVTLRLSSDDKTYNTQQIAYHTGYTGVRQWNKYSSQRSQAIYLDAGQRYYIEAQMKEAGGQDHLAVGWNLPSQHASPPQVIPGAYLEPYLDDPYDDWACSCPEGCDSIVPASVPGSFDNPPSGCYFFENLGSSIDSENMTEVNLNGQDITNSWQGSGNYPSRLDGGYYLYVEGKQNYDEEEEVKPVVNLTN